MSDYTTARREFDPVMVYPIAKGWNPDGTYTRQPGRLVALRGGTVDPWDSARSSMPYPQGMPALDAKPLLSTMGQPQTPIHMRTLRHFEHQILTKSQLFAGGDHTVLPSLKLNIVRAHALRWEHHRPENPDIPILSEDEKLLLSIETHGGEESYR